MTGRAFSAESTFQLAADGTFAFDEVDDGEVTGSAGTYVRVPHLAGRRAGGLRAPGRAFGPYLTHRVE